MDPLLEGLQPQALWAHFDELRKIPHGSGQEAGLRQYVLSVARRNQLPAQVDQAGNVVVMVPASPGHASAQTVVLQGHLDMVCEKNDDVDHDFRVDPIALERDGDWLKARGTTLGADNGIGVAAALALVETPDLLHGPLEILLTVEEETGLVGASALTPELLQGRILLNLDSETLGVATIGCAGGRDVTGRLPISLEPVAPGSVGLEIRVSGLLGGHSGLDIHLHRGNAIHILADLLSRMLEQNLPFSLASISGGNQRNAIPREAKAWLVLAPRDEQRARELATAAQGDARLIAGDADPDLSITVTPTDPPTHVISQVQPLVWTLHGLPSGVLAMSREIPGLVETSNNLGVVRTDPSEVTVICAPRSSVDAALDQTARSIASLLNLAGARSHLSAGYPGWRPDPDSPLVHTVKKVHRQVFGTEIELEACHAGLECGLIGEKYPGMQMVSFGPTILSPHSPDERVRIDSVEGFWRLLTALLHELA